MDAIRGIYDNGVVRPLEPVDWPNHTAVICQPQPPSDPDADARANDAIYEVLGRRYRSGHRDTAERHDEHQP